VGRWGLLALFGGSCLWLGRGLLPSARFAAGLAGLAFDLAPTMPVRPASAVEDHQDPAWPDDAASDDATVDLLRRLSAPIERLTSAEAIVRHALGWAREALEAPWAAIVLGSRPSAATVHGLGEYPGDLERLAPVGGEPAASADQVGPAGPLRAVPLRVGGALVGTLVLPPPEAAADPVPGGRERLLEGAVPLIAAALRCVGLARQSEELAGLVAERDRKLGALSDQLVRAQEEVRRRISLDLHDEPLQRAILLHRRISDSADHPQAARWLSEIEEIASSIRAICNGLRPRVLDDFGLAAGLEWLVDDVRARSDLTAYLTTASSDSLSSDRLPADLELSLFRIAQEALNNCLKHARATQVYVTLWREGQRVRLIVADDGQSRPDGSGLGGGRGQLGIAGMRERLRPWGGVVTARAGTEGGTIVTADVSAEDGVGASD
jgi:signal transduction histidine kinase